MNFSFMCKASYMYCSWAASIQCIVPYAQNAHHWYVYNAWPLILLFICFQRAAKEKAREKKEKQRSQKVCTDLYMYVLQACTNDDFIE